MSRISLRTINVLGVFGAEVFERFEDTHGRTQAEVGPVHHGFVAAKRHHTPPDLHLVGTEFDEFLRQDFFQSLEGFGNQFKGMFHSREK